MHFVMTRDFKSEIKVDNFDAWNCDYTIGVVIHAVMTEYLRQDSGHGRMDLEDVPEEFHEEYHSGEDFMQGFSLGAWRWMVGEIIWSTDMDAREKEGYSIVSDLASYDKMWERRSNAMRLFGKYFFGFWN